MEIPNYTEMEERLLRENRDLREKIKKLDQELLDQISHTGVWIEKLKEKSQQVIDLIAKYEPDPYEANDLHHPSGGDADSNKTRPSGLGA